MKGKERKEKNVGKKREGKWRRNKRNGTREGKKGIYVDCLNANFI